MSFWDSISWSHMHDAVRVSRVVPAAVRPAIADLRHELARQILAAADTENEETFLKALWFLDSLLFASRQKRRGGRRGQHGETVARTIARRLRAAGEGQWSSLWHERSEAIRTGLAAGCSAEKQLAKDVADVLGAFRTTISAMPSAPLMAGRAWRPIPRPGACCHSCFPAIANQ